MKTLISHPKTAEESFTLLAPELLGCSKRLIQREGGNKIVARKRTWRVMRLRGVRVLTRESSASDPKVSERERVVLAALAGEAGRGLA